VKLHLKKLSAHTLITVLEERIDAHNSNELKSVLLQSIAQGNACIIVQLETVRFIDSSGLGALLSGYKNAAAQNGKLVLTNIQQQVLSMFELTRLNRVFEIYPDVNEALGSKPEGPP